MQAVIVGVIVAASVVILARKLWKTFRRRCADKKKAEGCGKCSGCG
jgi:hypothetical protein